MSTCLASCVHRMSSNAMHLISTWLRELHVLDQMLMYDVKMCSAHARTTENHKISCSKLSNFFNKFDDASWRRFTVCQCTQYSDSHRPRLAQTLITFSHTRISYAERARVPIYMYEQRIAERCGGSWCTDYHFISIIYRMTFNLLQK